MTMRRDIEAFAPTATSGPRGRMVVATIGIDRYQHWQRLANAVRDATETAALFGRLGFEQVTGPLLDQDATGQAIQSLATVDLKKLLGPDDSLVLFYAGHGATYGHLPGGEEIKTGYLIPADASSSPEDISTWIDLEGWLRGVALLPAKHILVILDACRSGIALDGVIQRHRGDDAWQHETSAALQVRRSRRIITSALGDQVALDSGPKHGHSLFTGCLLEGLSYDLRRRGDRTMTGSGLGTYLQRRVDAYTKSQQTPDFGTFFHDDRGELAIPLMDEGRDHPTPAPSSSTLSRHTASSAAWPEKRQAALAILGRERVSGHGSPNDAKVSHLVRRLEHAMTMEAQRMTMRALLVLVASVIALFLVIRILDLWDKSGVLTERVAAGVVVICGFAVLANLALRAIVPIKMRRVIQAVRDAPERVVLLRYQRETAEARRTAVITRMLLGALLWVLVMVYVPVIGVLMAACLIAILGLRQVRRRATRSISATREVTASGWIEIRTAEHDIILKDPDDGPALFEALTQRCPAAMVGR